jgi:magnesium-transporting ATPase (P-type)
MAGKGLRCLATGIIYDGGNLSDLTKDNLTQKLANFDQYNHFETGGTFLGIMCIKDPVRHEVKQAIKDCNTAGIRVIMITGDAKDTAVAIAKELNILDSDSDIQNDVWIGQEFSELTE